MAEDYYDALGVARSATPDEIQKAYRRLARKHHPDLADDKDKAKEEFQKIQHAYDVLSDPEKREMYDQFGSGFEQGAAQNPFAGGQMPEGFDMEQVFGGRGGGGGQAGGFEDILRQVFGGAGGGTPFGQRGDAGTRTQPPPPAHGQDVEQQITIPFATAVLGGKHQLSLTRSSGDVETITVTIPAGIADGKRIRLRGQGRSQRGGPRGDLFVKVHVAPHPVYQRSGDNLQLTVPVSVSEAALGARIDLPTPHGTVTLTIPGGSSGGKLLRLKGLGIKKTDGTAGDLVAELRIVVPDKLSPEQENLFQSLAEQTANENPRSKLKW